ncbi:HNH endonuclease family protein [Corynebacterium sp.]|uniref:HNH endonuclease family protein n=1 Tax=Corynebacterium sp. TaxID=1720 RepID=UPI0026DA8987|nr:HNH endonuclease family protein [Corynebacterium sp.]MDO5031982.1 HNH endonuclease family protein [Corynebacterium sp.]
MNFRTLYVATLGGITALLGAYQFLPGPSLGVATVPARVELPGYVREDFGGWLPGTKDAVRASQMRAGVLYDPYADAPAPARVEVDHVFPLSAAWDMGAATWPAQRKAEFANDPLNLVATDRALNQAKSDKLPAQWLPPKRRCDYSKRLAAVAIKYQLPLPAADHAVMRKQCRLDILLHPR